MREGRSDHFGVTVIILTCGDFEGLERTLDSVIGQSCHLDAVIVSDDGSGERFPAVVQEQFPQVKFQANRQNLGTVAHMNKTASETKSEYIKFLAAGDAFSDPEALAALLMFARDQDTPIITSQSMICDKTLTYRLYPFPGRRAKQLRETERKLFRVLSFSNLISAPATLFNRSFFTRLGGFDESYRLLEDWPAWLRLAREGYSIPFLDRVTCLHAVGGVSSEDLDAYHSLRLQRDMILCYEKEILPYLDGFSSGELKRVWYGHDLARGLTHRELLKQYWWLEHKTRMKRSVKRWLLKRWR